MSHRARTRASDPPRRHPVECRACGWHGHRAFLPAGGFNTAPCPHCGSGSRRTLVAWPAGAKRPRLDVRDIRIPRRTRGPSVRDAERVDRILRTREYRGTARVLLAGGVDGASSFHSRRHWTRPRWQGRSGHIVSVVAAAYVGFTPCGVCCKVRVNPDGTTTGRDWNYTP